MCLYVPLKAPPLKGAREHLTASDPLVVLAVPVGPLRTPDLDGQITRPRLRGNVLQQRHSPLDFKGNPLHNSIHVL